MILNLQKQYSEYIDSTHNLVMILTLHTLYSDDIDSINTV